MDARSQQQGAHVGFRDGKCHQRLERGAAPRLTGAPDKLPGFCGRRASCGRPTATAVVMRTAQARVVSKREEWRARRFGTQRPLPSEGSNFIQLSYGRRGKAGGERDVYTRTAGLPVWRARCGAAAAIAPDPGDPTADRRLVERQQPSPGRGGPRLHPASANARQARASSPAASSTSLTRRRAVATRARETKRARLGGESRAVLCSSAAGGGARVRRSGWRRRDAACARRLTTSAALPLSSSLPPVQDAGIDVAGPVQHMKARAHSRRATVMAALTVACRHRRGATTQ